MPMFPKHFSPAIAALALPALLLAACATTTASTQPPVATRPAATSLDNWSNRVQVESDAEEIRLASHATGLSGNQARALTDFHARWMQAEGGVITIAAPRDSGQEAGAYRVGNQARDLLLRLGAPADKVRLVGYDAGGEEIAPVIVDFQRHVAVAPTCGDWNALTRSFTNEPHAGFGCAIAANIAAQVANPEDLTDARTMTPADPGRRSVVFGKYRTGEATSAAKEQQGSGTVSQAIR